jgi:CheY-like chemotaxis protein
MPSEPVILLAEDREDDILVIRRAFAKSTFPYLLRVVRNGEEVLSYLRGEPPYDDRAMFPLPALLLLDLNMPRKDGFEVLEWIRQQPDLFSLRVVVLTSSELSSDTTRAYEAGANSFLVKPTDFQNYVELTEFINGFWLQFNSTLQVTTST